MSFLVKTLLGNNVVHPVEREAGESSAVEQQDEKRVPTRTLIFRVQSCTLPQDRRDALRELQGCSDLPYVMAAKEVSYFCNMLRTFSDDDDIVDLSLALLSNITDLTSYPAGSTTYTVSGKERQQICDSFLHELVSEVPLFLAHVKAGSFWSRFNAVQLLQRLQEHDPSAVHKLLLSSHGIGVLVDILNDNTHDGALRNEGLVLITSITAMDTELQTLLAFDNAFDTLFSVINEEGGIDGGVIVSDCLTITHNMLRDNKATQKFFIEMGCSRLVCRLLEAVTERIQSVIHNLASHKKQGASGSDNTEILFTPLSSTQNDVVFMAVSILGCIVRGAETHKECPTTKDMLVQHGVLGPLASLGLGGVAVDDRVRVEALRTLAVLLQDQMVGIEKFAQLQVVTLYQDESLMRAMEWSALRAVLHVLLEVEDRVMQSAAAQIFHALLNCSVCEAHIDTVLLRGFAFNLSLTTPATGLNIKGKNMFAVDCGVIIANALFGAIPFARSSRKYYAALLLDLLLSLPNVAELLMTPAEHVGAIAPSQAKTAAPPTEDSTFIAYVQYVMKCFCGQGEMDLNTLSACFRLLLRWTVSSRKAVQLFLGDTKFYKMFLQRAGQDDGPVHVRFWSAILCAALCIAAPQEESETTHKNIGSEGKKRLGNSGSDVDTTPLSLQLDGRQLLGLFFNHLGGPCIFESLLFDVKASSPVWLDPPKSAFLRPTPVLYDESLKSTLLGIIKQFNDICFLHNKVSETQLTEGSSVSQNPVVAVTGDMDRFSQISLSSTEKLTGAFEAVSVSQPPCSQQALGVNKDSCVMDPELRDAYEAKVRELTEKNTALEHQLQLLQKRVNADAEERDRQYMEEVNYLKENIRLLEEALGNKEEEHQAMAHSLNILDEQLRAALANRVDTTELLALRREVQTLTKERDQLLILAAELDESLTPMKSTQAKTMCPSLSAPSAFPSQTAPHCTYHQDTGALRFPHHMDFSGAELTMRQEHSQGLSEATGLSDVQTLPPIQQQQQQQRHPLSVTVPLEGTGATERVLLGSVTTVPAAENNLFSDASSSKFLDMNTVGTQNILGSASLHTQRPLPSGHNPFASMGSAKSDETGNIW